MPGLCSFHSSFLTNYLTTISWRIFKYLFIPYIMVSKYFLSKNIMSPDSTSWSITLSPLTISKALGSIILNSFLSILTSRWFISLCNMISDLGLSHIELKKASSCQIQRPFGHHLIQTLLYGIQDPCLFPSSFVTPPLPSVGHSFPFLLGTLFVHLPIK